MKTQSLIFVSVLLVVAFLQVETAQDINTEIAGLKASNNVLLQMANSTCELAGDNKQKVKLCQQLQKATTDINKGEKDLEDAVNKTELLYAGLCKINEKINLNLADYCPYKPPAITAEINKTINSLQMRSKGLLEMLNSICRIDKAKNQQTKLAMCKNYDQVRSTFQKGESTLKDTIVKINRFFTGFCNYDKNNTLGCPPKKGNTTNNLRARHQALLENLIAVCNLDKDKSNANSKLLCENDKKKVANYLNQGEKIMEDAVGKIELLYGKFCKLDLINASGLCQNQNIFSNPFVVGNAANFIKNFNFNWGG